MKTKLKNLPIQFSYYCQKINWFHMQRKCLPFQNSKMSFGWIFNLRFKSNLVSFLDNSFYMIFYWLILWLNIQFWKNQSVETILTFKIIKFTLILSTTSAEFWLWTLLSINKSVVMMKVLFLKKFHPTWIIDFFFFFLFIQLT
jgi:hypothetical protein